MLYVDNRNKELDINKIQTYKKAFRDLDKIMSFKCKKN